MSSKTLTANTDELFDLVRKSEGIISTFEARSLETNPETVEDDYRRYADTHISLGDTSGFEQAIYDDLVEDESPTKGYFYGKYGYGKTSTAVSIWHQLNENDILAVPPFTMDSFAATMRATYGWMRYEFEHKAPAYIDDLKDIHDRYLRQELRSVAEEKEGQFDLDFEKLVEMFEQMEQEGDLDLSIKSDTLIDFFDECTDLATEAGFDGLVVVADEFQEYFNSADNETDAESRFRQLAFALHSGTHIQSKFGLMISMPETTKSMLDSRAEDILNRLQADNLVLNLQNVYGRDFPSELWSRYADRFNFSDQRHEVISEPALIAAGEVCSRNDLSNGPRTVMDIFRLALRQYQNSQERFTALDLAEAFYEGEVRYQGSGTKIQTAIGDALNHSTVTASDQEIFLKLCGVFPKEGVPDSVVQDYDLAEAREELTRTLQGEVIKYVADGYALIDVTRRDGPEDVVQELIYDFWRDYRVNQRAAVDAIDGFANKLLDEEIFESVKGGSLEGWTNNGKTIQQISNTKYVDQLEGTFNTRYPRRRLSLNITDNEDDIGDHRGLGEDFGNPDIAFNFVFKWEVGGEDAVQQHIRKESDREYTFVLNGRQTYDGLPSNLEFLRDAMDPNAVSPLLMLALVHYLDDPDVEIDAQQETRINSFQQSLLEQSLKALFDEELISNAPFELRRAGRRAVEQVFTNAMEELYPNYHTVITSSQFRDMMDDYNDFLLSLKTTSKRRGNEPVSGSKAEIAERFNLRSTSSFGSRIRKHYDDLLVVENDKADDYQVSAKLHPFEQEILERIERSSQDKLSLSKVEELAFKQGYRREEVEIIGEFMFNRGIVEYAESEDAFVIAEKDIKITDVEETVETCWSHIRTIKQLDSDRVPDGIEDRLATVEEGLTEANPEDGEYLERLSVEAQHIQTRLAEVGELLYDHYRSNCNETIQAAKRKRRTLTPNHLDEEVTSGVQFVGGLNDARTKLKSQFNSLQDDLSDIITNLEESLRTHSDATLSDAKHLHDQADTQTSQLEEIEEQKQDLDELADELEQWRTFTDRVGSVKQNIQDYSHTFDESIPEEDQITDLIGQIAERLAEDPLDALTDRSVFAERLDAIEDAYEERRSERREIFNSKQEALNGILRDATDGRANRVREAFDIKQPDESRRRLLDEFKQLYQENIINRVRQRIDKAREEVEYARIVGVAAETDTDADQIETQLDKAEADVTQLESTIDRFEFNEINSKTQTLTEDGQQLLNTTEDLQHRALSFNEQVEPDDARVQELLERVRDGGDSSVKELLMDYHSDGEQIDLDDLLDRLAQLFKDNQIDITISPRRRR